ncbi:protein indeterminate-domain 12-like [Hibiscus syriacus]|uniref:protein indeterminate-domain 12-like n=1 Tax=Hibiscus syriacus TaxID=106335 RepID=UPI0019204D63|nr:protein indeterminate-domain 12-like [Hibiscus syriacus]
MTNTNMPVLLLEGSSSKQLPVSIHQCQGQLNMSNFVQNFGEDEHHTTVISQSSNESPNPLESDPDAEVVALSPRTLMATNRYICEVCHKGFQRDQNLQLHRRGHNLPWKLKQRTNTEVVKKRVYVCPEPNCVHHNPSRALGDLTGIKKHFCRKHGEKKWKCDKCSKRYAVQSDWKAHAKICGTREYHCDCGTIFSRKDSFVTHRAFCDALTEETYKVNRNHATTGGILPQDMMPSSDSYSNANTKTNLSISNENMNMFSNNLNQKFNAGTSLASTIAIGSAYTSATALLQKAAEMGAKISDTAIAPILLRGFTGYSTGHITSTMSVQDGSSMVGSNIETNGASTNVLISRNTLAPTALFHTHILHAENGKCSNLFGEMYMEGGGKTTVDFLGVEPTGDQNVDTERSYEGNIMNLGCSNEQQLSLNNLHANW